LTARTGRAAVRSHDEVTDLPGGIPRSEAGNTVEKQPGPYPVADVDDHEVVLVAVETRGGHDGGVRVVGDVDGNAEFRAQQVPEGVVLPAEVRGGEHRARGVDDAGAAHPDTEQGRLDGGYGASSEVDDGARRSLARDDVSFQGVLPEFLAGEVERGGPKLPEVREVEADEVPRVGVDLQQGRGFARPPRGAQAEFGDDAGLDEFGDEIGDGHASEFGLSCDIGPGGDLARRAAGLGRGDACRAPVRVRSTVRCPCELVNLPSLLLERG